MGFFFFNQGSVLELHRDLGVDFCYKICVFGLRNYFILDLSVLFCWNLWILFRICFLRVGFGALLFDLSAGVFGGFCGLNGFPFSTVAV